jgi:YVTN family beta-propeller protein
MNMAISPDGSKLFVNNYAGNSVSVITTSTNSVTATIAVESAPNGIGITPDGARLYVANQLSNTVSVINTATNTMISTIWGVANPYEAVMASDGSFYVTSVLDNAIYKINTSTNTLTNTYVAGNAPIDVVAGPCVPVVVPSSTPVTTTTNANNAATTNANNAATTNANNVSMSNTPATTTKTVSSQDALPATGLSHWSWALLGAGIVIVGGVLRQQRSRVH